MDSGTKKQFEKWLEDMKLQTEDRMFHIAAGELDDSFGWGKMLRSYLGYKSASLKKKRGFLFAGAYGSGRHQAAYHVLQYMTTPEQWPGEKGEDPYEVLILSGEDMCDIPTENNGVYEYMGAVIDAYEGKNLVLLLEDPEKTPLCGEILRKLARYVCMFSAYPDDYPHLLLTVVTSDECVIPPILRQHLTLCRMTLPDAKKRRRFLEANAGESSSLGIALGMNGAAMTLDSLVDATEGLSYAQLRDLAESASMYVASEDSLEYEELPDLVGTQLPVVERDDEKRMFYLKMEQFIDELPELIERLPAPGAYVPAPAEKSEEKEKETVKAEEPLPSEDDLKSSIDNMTGRELAYDLFGKEATEELLKKGRELLNA